MRLLFLSCLVFLILSSSLGSKIQFKATPSNVLENLSSTLVLRCAINDTAASGSVIGRRDVTMTTDNVAEVSSLVIMLGGNDVAAVSHSRPAHMLHNLTNALASGAVTAGRDETGFLQVTIHNPTPGQTGEYVCESNAVSQTGHGVTFSTSLEVTHSTATMTDLVAYIRELQAQVAPVVVFSAGLTKHTTLAHGQVLVFDKVFTNAGSGYSPATGNFVCPVAGFYNFAIHAMSHFNVRLWLELQLNNKEIITIYCDNADNESCSNSINLQLALGDVVRVVSLHSQSPTSTVAGFGADVYTTFSGQLIAVA